MGDIYKLNMYQIEKKIIKMGLKYIVFASKARIL